MQTASLRARQDISKANQDATTLQNDRDTNIAQDRQQVEADMQEVDLKIAMYRDLMTEAEFYDLLSYLLASQQPAAAATPSE